MLAASLAPGFTAQFDLRFSLPEPVGFNTAMPPYSQTFSTRATIARHTHLLPHRAGPVTKDLT